MTLRQIQRLKLWRGGESTYFLNGEHGRYVGAGEQALIALDANYTERWRVKSRIFEHAVTEGADVVVTMNSKWDLRGRAAEDGREIWKAHTQRGILHRFGDEIFGLRQDETSVTSRDIATGALRREVAISGRLLAAGSRDVMFTTEVESDSRYKLAAISLKQGGIFWSRLIEGYPRIEPVGSTLVASSGTGFAVLEIATGGQIWRAEFKEPLVSWPFGEGGYLFAWTANTLWCYDQVLGKTLWERPLSDHLATQAHQTMRPFAFGAAVFWRDGDRLVGFDPASGNVVEELKVSVGQQAIPAGDDLILLSRYDIRVLRDDGKPWRKQGRLDRITMRAGVADGRPCIRDTGIEVADVVREVARGKSRSAIAGQHPGLEAEDIAQALKYAASLVAGKSSA